MSPGPSRTRDGQASILGGHVLLLKDNTYDSVRYLDHHFIPLNSLIPGASSVQTRRQSPERSGRHYYLLIVADGSHYVTESDESNNVFALPIALTVPDVDLVVTAAEAPSTSSPARTADVSWTVTNQGIDSTTAPYWYDYVYLLPTTSTTASILRD